MDGLPGDAELLFVPSGMIVSAPFVKLTRELAQDWIDGKWWNLPDVSTPARKQENDYAWRWAKQLGEMRNDKWFEASAIQTADGSIQGAILYRLDTLSFLEPEKGAVYVQALATAPRNRNWLMQQPIYRGVGVSRLMRAVIHSYLLGFGGRVALLSFADNRTMEFYRNRGFEEIEFEEIEFEEIEFEEGLCKLELSPKSAQELLRNWGYEP